MVKSYFIKVLKVKEIEKEVANEITNNSSGEIDYVSLLAYPSLMPYTSEAKEAIIACAVKFEKTRLIDNIIMLTKG